MLAAMLLAVGLYSCTEDPLFEERARVAEGLPARVMLDFRSEKSCVETRAAQDATNENRVNNLYVFIFNPAGEVHYRNFFTDDISYNGDYSKRFRHDRDHLSEQGTDSLHRQSIY